MSKLPSFQFYPGDWRKDPNLSRCSKAAKGVWLDMLCLMFECEDRGVLASGGRPWSDSDIAVAVGGDISEVLSCINELIEKGVASRNNAGCVYSRRLVRDEEQRKNHVKRQSKYRKSAGDAKSDAEVTRMSQPSSSSSSSSKKKTKTCASFEAPVPFEDFYTLYPKKKARADALKAWESLWKSSVLEESLWKERVRPALVAQMASDDWLKDGGAYVPLPATWLRGRRWEDVTVNQVTPQGGTRHWSEIPIPSKMN